MTKNFECDLPIGKSLAELFPNISNNGKKRRITLQTQSQKAIAEIVQAFIDGQQQKK